MATEAKRKYVAKQKERNSFSRALHALDINMVDGEAARAMWRLEACDELYDACKEAFSMIQYLQPEAFDDEDHEKNFTASMAKILLAIQKADGAEYRKEKTNVS